MTFPAFLVALLFALLIGALYHLLRGGGIGHLLLFLGLSALGFGAGHLLSLWLGWDFLPMGQLRVGLSCVGSIIFLIIGDWLSRFEEKPQSKV